MLLIDTLNNNLSFKDGKHALHMNNKSFTSFRHSLIVQK